MHMHWTRLAGIGLNGGSAHFGELAFQPSLQWAIKAQWWLCTQALCHSGALLRPQHTKLHVGALASIHKHIAIMGPTPGFYVFGVQEAG